MPWDFGRHQTLREQLQNLLDPPTREALPVPPFLVDTVLGEMLAGRMLHSLWSMIREEDIDPVWREDVEAQDLLRVQKRLGLVRGGSVSNLCSVCGSTARRRCGLCLSVNYCGDVCQQAGWAAHKKTCVRPIPKINANLVVSLPDYRVSFYYMNWHENQEVSKRIGVMITNREEWVSAHGEEALRRTFFSLAVHGKPTVILARVLSKKECRPL